MNKNDPLLQSHIKALNLNYANIKVEEDGYVHMRCTAPLTCSDCIFHTLTYQWCSISDNDRAEKGILEALKTYYPEYFL